MGREREREKQKGSGGQGWTLTQEERSGVTGGGGTKLEGSNRMDGWQHHILAVQWGGRGRAGRPGEAKLEAFSLSFLPSLGSVGGSSARSAGGSRTGDHVRDGKTRIWDFSEQRLQEAGLVACECCHAMPCHSLSPSPLPPCLAW
jgi:hypothetical protein